MKVQTVLLLACFVACAKAASYYDVVSEEWEEWKLLHGKTYRTAGEHDFRMKIFMYNKEKIAEHNVLALQGQEGYFLKMNQFGDLLNGEFRSLMNGLKPGWQTKQLKEGITQIPPAHVELPEEVDWRTLGGVTDVKDQGKCGSCWAFSATGGLEGQHFRKTGKLVSLSEQNLVDCSSTFEFGNEGCDGGDPDFAFKYIKANGGIDTETSYPYREDGLQGVCTYNPTTVGATDKGFVIVTPDDEEALKAAVATVGPVSVGIDASNPSFQFYSHGIYDEPNCTPQRIDHAVLIVGYGTNDKGDYWIVKNSWAKTWGDEGYIQMSRNKDNQCGIASAASYPAV